MRGPASGVVEATTLTRLIDGLAMRPMCTGEAWLGYHEAPGLQFPSGKIAQAQQVVVEKATFVFS